MIQAKTKVCASCGRSNDSFLRTCGCGAALSEVPALRPPVTKSAAEPSLNKRSSGPVVLTKAPVEIKAPASRPRPLHREAPVIPVERAAPDASVTVEEKPAANAPPPDLLEGEGRWRTYALVTLPIALIAISAAMAHRYGLPPFAPAPNAPSSGLAVADPPASAPTSIATTTSSSAPLVSASAVAVMVSPVDAMSKNEFVDYAKSAVVLINTKLAVKNGSLEIAVGSSGGTGFFVSNDGLIATALHVLLNERRIEQFRQVSIQLEEGAVFNTVWCVGEDRANDLALLRIRKKGTPFFKLSSIPKARENTDIMVVSHPLSLEKWSVTQGTVTGYRSWKGRDLYGIDARTEMGSSGAPVIMIETRDVIGIVDVKLGESTMNYAVRIEPLRRLVADVGNKEGTPCGADSSNDGWEGPAQK